MLSLIAIFELFTVVSREILYALIDLAVKKLKTIELWMDIIRF